MLDHLTWLHVAAFAAAVFVWLVWLEWATRRRPRITMPAWVARLLVPRPRRRPVFVPLAYVLDHELRPIGYTRPSPKTALRPRTPHHRNVPARQIIKGRR